MADTQKLSEALFKSFDIFINSGLGKIEADATVIATISKVLNTEKGYYRVSYTGGEIPVYSLNGNKYVVGDIVYITIPQGNMSNRKIIQGLAEERAIGEDYESTSSNKISGFTKLCDNCINNKVIYKKEDKKVGYGDKLYPIIPVISPVGEQVITTLYSANIPGSYDNPQLEVFNEQFRNYIRNGTAFQLIGTFCSRFPKEESGEFYLKLTLSFGEEIREYILSSRNMNGNPYKFTSGLSRYAIFNLSAGEDEIDVLSFSRIEKIELITEGFSVENSMKDAKGTPYLKVYDIGLFPLGDSAIVDQETTLKFEIENGTFSTTDNSQNGSITARVLYEETSDITDECTFIWGIEDSSVEYTNTEVYNAYLGEGYRWLKEYTSKKLLISSGMVNTKEKEFICVAITNSGKTVRGSITIRNTAYTKYLELTLNGSKDTFISKDSTEFNIVATVYDENDNPPIPLTIDDSFIWTASFDNGKQFKLSYSSKDEIEAAKAAELLEAQNSDDKKSSLGRDKDAIEAYWNLQAEYFDAVKPDGNYFDNSITISRTGKGKFSRKLVITCSTKNNTVSSKKMEIVVRDTSLSNRLVIQNGSQIFQYDELGTSPFVDSTQDSGPLELVPVFYDAKNREIKDEALYKEVKWTYPTTNTLIKRDAVGFEAGKYTGPTFSFDIAEKFNKSYTNNQITATLTNGTSTYSAVTTFIFLKQGDIGSNGTSLTCAIETNSSYELQDTSEMLSYHIPPNGDGNHFWNLLKGDSYLPASFDDKDKLFSYNIYVNGELTSGTEHSHWYPAGSSQAARKGDKNFYIKLKNNSSGSDNDEKTGPSYSEEDSIGLVIDNNNKKEIEENLILELEVKYNNRILYNKKQIPFIEYYGTNSDITIDNPKDSSNRVKIIARDSLRQVAYDSSGTNPSYNNYAGLQLKVPDFIDKIEYRTSTDSDFKLLPHYEAPRKFSNTFISKTKDNKEFENIKGFFGLESSIFLDNDKRIYSEILDNIKNNNNNYETEYGKYISGDNPGASENFRKKLEGYKYEDLRSEYQKYRLVGDFNEVYISPNLIYSGKNNNIIKASLLYEEDNEYKTYATVYYPIIFYINNYNLNKLNAWDGSSIETENGYLAAPQVGAGHKEEDNSFSGIVIGDHVSEDKTETGLFAYHGGLRSVFINADTGAVELGNSSFNDGEGAVFTLDPIKNYAKIADWEFNSSVLYSVDRENEDNQEVVVKDFENRTSNSIHDYDLNKSGILLDATPGKSHIQIKKKQTKHYDSFYNITTPNFGDEVVIDIDSTDSAESVFLAKTYTDKPINKNIGFGWSDSGSTKIVQHPGQLVRCPQGGGKKYYVYEQPPLESIENRVFEADVSINAENSTYIFHDTDDTDTGRTKIIANINPKNSSGKSSYPKMAIHCKSNESITQDDYTFNFGRIESSGISNTLDGGFLVYFKKDRGEWETGNFSITCKNFPSETYPKYRGTFESTGYVNGIIDYIDSKTEILPLSNELIEKQLRDLLSSNIDNIIELAKEYIYSREYTYYKTNSDEDFDGYTLYLCGADKVYINYEDIEEEYKDNYVTVYIPGSSYVYNNQEITAVSSSNENDANTKVTLIIDIDNNSLKIGYNNIDYTVPSNIKIVDFTNTYYKKSEITRDIKDSYQTGICLAYCAFDCEQYDNTSETIPYKILGTHLIFENGDFQKAFESIREDINAYTNSVSPVGFWVLFKHYFDADYKENYDEYVNSNSVNYENGSLKILREDQKPNNTLHEGVDYNFTINLSNEDGINKLIDGISFIDGNAEVTKPRALTMRPYQLYFYSNANNDPEGIEVHGSLNKANKFIEYTYNEAEKKWVENDSRGKDSIEARIDFPKDKDSDDWVPYLINSTANAEKIEQIGLNLNTLGQEKTGSIFINNSKTQVPLFDSKNKKFYFKPLETRRIDFDKYTALQMYYDEGHDSTFLCFGDTRTKINDVGILLNNLSIYHPSEKKLFELSDKSLTISDNLTLRSMRLKTKEINATKGSLKFNSDSIFYKESTFKSNSTFKEKITCEKGIIIPKGTTIKRGDKRLGDHKHKLNFTTHEAKITNTLKTNSFYIGIEAKNSGDAIPENATIGDIAENLKIIVRDTKSTDNLTEVPSKSLTGKISCPDNSYFVSRKISKTDEDKDKTGKMTDW